MNRFHKSRGRLRYLRVLLPALLFCVMLLLLLEGLSSVSSAAAREEALRLRETVLQDAVQCYALEGFYPASLDYLEAYYGVSIDDRLYFVDYRYVASNLMPDITVLAAD